MPKIVMKQKGVFRHTIRKNRNTPFQYSHIQIQTFLFSNFHYLDISIFGFLYSNILVSNFQTIQFFVFII